MPLSLYRQIVFKHKQIKVSFLHISTVILPQYPPVYTLRSDETGSLPSSKTVNNDSLENTDTSALRTLDKDTNLVVCNLIKIKGYINKKFYTFAGLVHTLDFFMRSCLASRNLFIWVEAAGKFY